MIPLHILTGFLGSGKTTLLSALLREPRGERIAVLVNEAGELALDHLLLERIDEDVFALASGCICCTLRGELLESLARVLALRPTRIVLETTGLADPAPILHGLSSDPRLARTLSLAGVVAVVDAARVEDLLERQPEVRRQLDLADRIVLTKGDLAPERVAGALERLAAEAPGREVRRALHGQLEPDWLLATAPLGLVRGAEDARAWLHHHAGAPSYRSHAVSVDTPARIELVQLWLRLVTQLDGPRLLRIKALVECAASGDLFVLQSAEHAVSPPRRLARRPPDLGGARVVILERGLPDPALAGLLASLHSVLAGTPRA